MIDDGFPDAVSQVAFDVVQTGLLVQPEFDACGNQAEMPIAIEFVGRETELVCDILYLYDEIVGGRCAEPTAFVACHDLTFQLVRETSLPGASTLCRFSTRGTEPPSTSTVPPLLIRLPCTMP